MRAVTGLGWTVGATALMCWIGAIVLGWDELAVAALACAVAFLVALVYALGRSDFEVDLSLEPQRVTVGERAGGSLEVRNVGLRRSLPVGVELQIGSARRTFRVPSLARDVSHDELFVIPTTRRALIQVGPVSTVRGDPVGLVRREQDWTSMIELFVHPQIAMLDRLGSGFLRDLEGQTTQDLSPSDVAFHTLREYVPGDDLRHIHWKTTARIGTLMMRQFVDTRRSLLALLVPTAIEEYASDDEFELAVSMAASIGVRSLRDGQTVTTVAGRTTIPSLNPVGLLDALAGIENTERSGSLIDAVAEANLVAADASIVVMAIGSLMPLNEVQHALARLKATGRVLVVRADPLGQSEVRTFGDTLLFNVPDLSEFARLLFQASK